MDSPGLFDTTKSHEEISALVMQAIACMHPGPDAVIYVMKIGRYTDEEFGVYSRVKALLDASVTKYLIILFTHGDSLKGKDMKQLLEKAPGKLKEVLQECNYRFVVMDNIHKEDRSQVEQLLQSVKQLREENGHQPYQCPRYAFVGEKMEEEVGKRMKDVEARELQNKKHVQELNDNLQQVQDRALKEKEDFEKKEKEREEVMKSQQKETEARLQELARELQTKQVNAEQQQQQMDALRHDMQQAEHRQREENDQQREQEMQRMRQLNEEKDTFMQKLMAQRAEESRIMMEEHSKQMEKLKDEISNRPSQDESGCTIL